MKGVLHILIILSFVLSSKTNIAQNPDENKVASFGMLSGKVVDSISGKPIEFATIALWNMKNKSITTGGITGIDGKFIISKIKFGVYKVKIDFIGYKQKTISPITIPKKDGGVKLNLGVIQLKPSSLNLQDVEITAKRPYMTVIADRKIFDVSKSTTSDGESATEVLENIPSVDVDIDGNISMRGSTNIKILIDGKPSGLTGGSRQAILDQIPAASIETIEIITNPSAKFDPDGMSGIINIVLKKNKLKGFNGYVSLNAGIGNKYSGSGQLNYRNEKWNLYSAFSYRYNERYFEGTNHRKSILSDTVNILDQKIYGDRAHSSNLVKFGADYNLNEKNMVSLSMLISEKEHSRSKETEYRSYDENLLLTDYYIGIAEQQEEGGNMDINFSYRKDFKKPKELLTFDIRYSTSTEDEFEDFIQQPYLLNLTVSEELPAIQNNYVDNKNYITTIRADYENPIGKDSKIEAGYNSIIRNVDQSFIAQIYDTTTSVFINVDSLNNSFDYEEQIHSAYATYANKFGLFSFQAGVRLEQTFTKFVLLFTEDDYDNDYFSIYPSAHLNLDLDENRIIQLSYSRRVHRPRYRALNPFISYSDPLNLRTGNPYLKPEYINSYELSFSKVWDKSSLSSAIYYREIQGMITRIKTMDYNGVATTTYGNLNRGSSSGIEFIYSSNLLKWWSFTINSNVYYNTIDGSNIDADMNNNDFSYSAKLMSTWVPKKNFEIQLSGRYRGPKIISQGKIDEFYTFDLSVKKRIFNNKGSVIIRVKDIFDTRHFQYEASDYNFTQESWRKRESQTVQLSVTYSFGKLEQKDEKKRNYEDNEGYEDSGIE